MSVFVFRKVPARLSQGVDSPHGKAEDGEMSQEFGKHYFPEQSCPPEESQGGQKRE